MLVARKTVNGDGDKRSNQNFYTFVKAMPWNLIGLANFCLGAKVKLLILVRKRERAKK